MKIITESHPLIPLIEDEYKDDDGGGGRSNNDRNDANGDGRYYDHPVNNKDKPSLVGAAAAAARGGGKNHLANNNINENDTASESSFRVLVELIGARHLPINMMKTAGRMMMEDEGKKEEEEEGESNNCNDNTKNENNILMEPYCVVHYGGRRIHRTRPFSPPPPPPSSVGMRVLSLASHLILGGGGGGPSSPLGGGGGGGEFQKQQYLEQEIRRKRSLQNPIWTIQEDCLFEIEINRKDLMNQKALVCAIWVRQRLLSSSSFSSSPIRRKPINNNNEPPLFIGMIRIDCRRILRHCLSAQQQRLELTVTDEFSRRSIKFPRCPHDGGTEAERSQLAIRFRIASPADVALVKKWNQQQQQQNPPTKQQQQQQRRSINPDDWWSSLSSSFWKEDDDDSQVAAEEEKKSSSTATISSDDRLLPRAGLVTERSEKEIVTAAAGVGASSSITPTILDGTTATTTSATTPLLLSSSSSSSPPSYNHNNIDGAAAAAVRVKPGPDPLGGPHDDSNSKYMTPDALRAQMLLPSRKWIQAGGGGSSSSSSSSSSSAPAKNNNDSSSSSLGRIFVEILQCRDLPNVASIGSSVGNLTDAFCTLIYGDCMVQTNVINDELSPMWMPWTDRAFGFPIKHPSHVLYLGVFGFKRQALLSPHVPIGRVEINLRNLRCDTLYDLEYALCHHDQGYSNNNNDMIDGQHSRGKVRIRLRVEVYDERKFLLASLNLATPTIYLSTHRKKSHLVAKYTTFGKYGDFEEEEFSLHIFQGYIEEIIQGNLLHILYNLCDGVCYLCLWRNRVHFGKIALPLYSAMAFILGLFMVEYPSLFPAFFCMIAAWFLLLQMERRVNSPSPWRRCFSFYHYLRILITGKSAPTNKPIDKNEGLEGTKAQAKLLKERLQQYENFFKKKEALEKEVEFIAQTELQTEPKLLPVEQLIILHRVQAIVGNICRVFRTINAIVTWEESGLTFFLTAGLLVGSVVFLFVPWSFLFTWSGRLLILMLFGPQNIIVDAVYFQGRTDEQRLRQLFARRMFNARCKQEEARKNNSFRSILFGKHITYVPSIFRTSHRDLPLSNSIASCTTKKNRDVQSFCWNSYVPGQQLYGSMIPRPEKAYQQNIEQSKSYKNAIEKALSVAESSTDDGISTAIENQRQSTIDEGFEVIESFDEEEGLMQNNNLRSGFEENSLRELGIEVFDTDNEDERFITAWDSFHEFPDGDDDDEEEEETLSKNSLESEKVDTINCLDMNQFIIANDIRTQELGVEVRY